MAITINNKVYSYNNDTKLFDIVETLEPIHSTATIEDISFNAQKIRNNITAIEQSIDSLKDSYTTDLANLNEKKAQLEIELAKAVSEQEALTNLIQQNN